MFSNIQDLFYKTKDHRSSDDLGSDHLGSDHLGSDHQSDFVDQVSYPESDQASDKSDSTIDIINQFEFEKKLPYLDQVKTFDRKKLKKYVKVFNYIGINIKNDDELIFRRDYLYVSVGGYFLGSVYMPLLLIFNLCIFLYINYDHYKDRIICDHKGSHSVHKGSHSVRKGSHSVHKGSHSIYNNDKETHFVYTDHKESYSGIRPNK
jgi:hypothetical protein